VHFIKSKPAHIRFAEDGRPVLHGERTVGRQLYAEVYDLVVLATGMEPVLPARMRSNGVEVDPYGFMVAHEPGDETAHDGASGIWPAGVASAPLDVSMSVQSATAAALRAVRAARAG
jgi:quinone-modifying oxidoreductase subunit QmoA